MNLKYLENKFKNKKVFITGHTGFKGSWLSFLLYKLGANVTGYALLPKERLNNFELLKLESKINHFEGNICDYNSLFEIVKKVKPDYFFHLAAQAIVKDSYRDPVDTFNTNIFGSVNILETVKKLDHICNLVFITSDKCYENLEQKVGYVENDKLGGIDPYSASKAAAEIIFSSYQRSFFSHRIKLGAASARAGNVIGGGDWSKSRIVPDCIRSINNNKTLKIRNPNSTRPWQHVLEPISGYLALAIALDEDPKSFSSSWNFGPNENDVKSVIRVANGKYKKRK